MKKLLFLLAVVPMVLVSCNQKTDPDNPGGTDDPNNPGKTETPDQSEKYGITATDMGLSVLWADKNIGALDDKLLRLGRDHRQDGIPLGELQIRHLQNESQQVHRQQHQTGRLRRRRYRQTGRQVAHAHHGRVG